MYLLYTDESGSVKDPSQTHFVLAGIAMSEKQVFWISTEMNKIAMRFSPEHNNSIELHANPMHGGQKIWRKFPKELRHEAIKDCLRILGSSHVSNRIFACVVNKNLISDQDPVEYAFEQMASRFDYFLDHLHKNNDPQRGIMIFDKSKYETAIQNLAINFRTLGHTWGVIRNFAEVPLFLDSRASRLIQMADIVAYAIYRAYEANDTQFLDLISHRIHSTGGIQNGLHEII